MEITIVFSKLSLSDFSDEQRQLHEAALDAMSRSHSPYSNFSVACAIRFRGGELVTGNNQENAAYPSGLCAERVALFKGKSEGYGAIDTMLVMAKNDRSIYCESSPCGGCRQVMMEYAIQQEESIKVLMQLDKETFYLLEDAKSLLPFGFTKHSL